LREKKRGSRHDRHDNFNAAPVAVELPLLWENSASFAVKPLRPLRLNLRARREKNKKVHATNATKNITPRPLR